MASPGYARSLVNLTKRLKLSAPTPSIQCQSRSVHQRASPSILPSQRTIPEQPQTRHASTDSAVQPSTTTPPPAIDPETAHRELQNIRLPRAVQATYLEPLRRKPTHHHPSCDLQLRSYSVRNLEVFADFALRAAYYLELSAAGPVPLPRITERWTVPRSNFVHKKSQENFERITMRRLIQIKGGHPETVAVWLAFLKKYQYYGIGMKANVFEYGGMEVGEDLGAEAEKIQQRLCEQLELVGGKPGLMRKEEAIDRMLNSEPFKAQWGAYAPMAATQSVPNAGVRIEKRAVDGTTNAKSIL